MNLKTYLQTAQILTDEQANAIDFLKTDGLATVQNIMRLKYGIRAIYTGNDDEDDITTLPEDLHMRVKTVFDMHAYNWTKKYVTLSLVYNPLNATDWAEHTTDTEGGKNTETNHEANSGTDTITDTNHNTGTQGNTDTRTDNLDETMSKNSYDNLTMTAVDDRKNTGTVSAVSQRTDDLTQTGNTATVHGHAIDSNKENSFGHTMQHDKTVTGRENMTPQDLILQERKVAEYNFYEMIADEVTDFITTLTYEF